MQQLKVEQKNEIELCDLMMKELEMISKAANNMARKYNEMTYIAPTELEALK